MIKKIAWETFKNTGNINTFLELKEIENIDEGMGEHFFKSPEEELGRDKI